jgi:hypothetical protein
MKNEPRTGEFLAQTQALRKLVAETDNHFLMNSPPEVTQKSLKNLRDRLYVYSGNGQLPARNIANLGYILYSEHILSVELAGTLLLVATIGAVAITQRRKEGTV